MGILKPELLAKKKTPQSTTAWCYVHSSIFAVPTFFGTSKSTSAYSPWLKQALHQCCRHCVPFVDRLLKQLLSFCCSQAWSEAESAEFALCLPSSGVCVCVVFGSLPSRLLAFRAFIKATPFRLYMLALEQEQPISMRTLNAMLGHECESRSFEKLSVNAKWSPNRYVVMRFARRQMIMPFSSLCEPSLFPFYPAKILSTKDKLCLKEWEGGIPNFCLDDLILSYLLWGS